MTANPGQGEVRGATADAVARARAILTGGGGRAGAHGLSGAPDDGRGGEFPVPDGIALPPFALADFQQEAVRAAAAVLARYGGVLLADSVGLGKTYVALALMTGCAAAGRGVLVTAPAALRGVWSHALGKAPIQGPVTWISHAGMGRGGVPAGCRCGLVVVDEAHAFRNPATRRYRRLACVAAGRRVILISATPVNNSLSDLYFLLRLVVPDAAFSHLGVPSLRALMRAPDPDPAAIRAVLSEIMVRRTRTQLEARFGELRLPGGSGFPRRMPPHRLSYSLGPALASALPVLEELAFAHLADVAASADRAERGRGQAPADLLRLGLLKRLESGRAAFIASLRRHIGYAELFERELRAGRVARPDAAVSSDPDQLLLAPVLFDAVPASADVSALADEVARDLDRLRRLLLLASTNEDPKPAALVGWLRQRWGRTLIFTEFRDTARDLHRRLSRLLRVALIDGEGAWMGGVRSSRAGVIACFSPASNHVAGPRRSERVDVLIATDVVSEGLNLQDAACVVSYDLPWNPVRMMQRVGRIDRLGSPHGCIQPCLMLPDDALDAMLGLLSRIRAKLRAIDGSVGVDGDPLDGVLGEAEAPLVSLAGPGWRPPIGACSGQAPHGAPLLGGCVAEAGGAAGWLLIYASADRCRARFAARGGGRELGLRECFRLVEAAERHPCAPPAELPAEVPLHLPEDGGGGAFERRLAARLWRMPGLRELGPEGTLRLDRVMARLRAGLSMHQELRAAAVLRMWGGGGGGGVAAGTGGLQRASRTRARVHPDRLLEDLEAALTASESRAAGPFRLAVAIRFCVDTSQCQS